MKEITNIHKLKNNLKSNMNYSRYKHSVKTMKIAEKLAKKYNLDSKKIKLAALLHDYGKDIEEKKLIEYIKNNNLSTNNSTPSSLHGPVGAILVQENFDIYDSEILDAIRFHTTGQANMSSIQKIVCISDFIEKDKKGYIPKMIKYLSAKNINRALVLMFNYKINILRTKGKPVNIKLIESRNNLVKYIKNQNLILKEIETLYNTTINNIKRDEKMLLFKLRDFEKEITGIIEKKKISEELKKVKISNFVWFKPWTWSKYGTYSIKNKPLVKEKTYFCSELTINNINNYINKSITYIEKVYIKYSKMEYLKPEFENIFIRKIDSHKFKALIEKNIYNINISSDNKKNIKKIQKNYFNDFPKKIYSKNDKVKFKKKYSKLLNTIDNTLSIYCNEQSKTLINSLNTLKKKHLNIIKKI
ncbi:MAG: bis(5'-nucleosyl)-tetraphosphatase (symmetrical) YqeK [Clostridiales bacterium]